MSGNLMIHTLSEDIDSGRVQMSSGMRIVYANPVDLEKDHYSLLTVVPMILNSNTGEYFRFALLVNIDNPDANTQTDKSIPGFTFECVKELGDPNLYVDWDFYNELAKETAAK